MPEPRDYTLEPISAPLVTSHNLKALIDSPQFQQTIILSSGRRVSYTACGSRTGTPILYFYGLGGSSRQVASLHAQAVRLDIKLLCVDRPGTGFTDPFKSSASTRRRKQKHSSKQEGEDVEEQQYLTGIKKASGHPVDGEDNADDHHHHNNSDNHGNKGRQGSTLLSRQLSQGNKKSIRKKPRLSPPTRKLNERVHHSCLEALAVVDHLIPGARFGLMGHSCGIYYVMHMVDLFPERIQPGPISLLTPWVPFNECPETTSRTFKFLKHVPRSIVWAVTSSINHLGSMILSSSNALSGAWSNKNMSDGCVEELPEDNNDRNQDVEDIGTSNNTTTTKTDSEPTRRSGDTFIMQFSDAFDKVLLPALVQDMNRQHSNGYNNEIQMCISDVGFDLASIELPEDVTINAYCGYLDTVVPIEAARDMGKKCGWKMHEFKYSGHGGPRMSMYALEDYTAALQAIQAAKFAEEHWSEKHF
ncbi:hypothetical protein BGZ65_002037 [Modicella reniformis]|uniref:AB hydrolase-1 domain-containing protein n=1 Tax=Modicella reniformis TaxID=1440133 RepID=A0A9P6J6B8_9FUNG|nr:hypothetical protein BGZ65_002037 [Modicella reniformis]